MRGSCTFQELCLSKLKSLVVQVKLMDPQKAPAGGECERSEPWGHTRNMRGSPERSAPKARRVRGKRTLGPQQEHGGPVKHFRAPGGDASCLFVSLFVCLS